MRGRFVSKADFPFVDRKAKRDLYKRSILQICLDKIFDDTGNTDTDPRKFDQEIHIGNVNGIFDLYLMFLQIVIDILARHIIFIQKHQCRVLQDL